MNRPGKPKGQHYLAHQAVDTDRGVIVDVVVTPGDVNDSVPYLEQIERINKEILPIQTATADAAYDFPLAHRVLHDLGIQFAVRSKTELTREDFRYDEAENCYMENACIFARWRGRRAVFRGSMWPIKRTAGNARCVKNA